MIRMLSIVGTFVNCVLLVLLIVHFRGLDEGLTEGSGFSIAGETGNQFLVRCYTYVGVMHVFYLIGLFIRNRYFSIPLRFSALILGLFFYWRVFAQKFYVYNTLDAGTAALNNSLAVDIAILAIIILLFFLQLLGLVRERSVKSEDFP